MRRAADGVAASLVTPAPAEDRQRAAILQARGRRRTPPGKIVADGRLQPEPRGIAAPMTRFTVKQGRGVAPYRQEHDAFGNAIRRRTSELACRSEWKVRRTKGPRLPGPHAHGVPDWLTARPVRHARARLTRRRVLAVAELSQPALAKCGEDEQSRAPCKSRCAPIRAPVHGIHVF